MSSFVYHPRAHKISYKIKGWQDAGVHNRYEKIVSDNHPQFDAVDINSLNHRVDTKYNGNYDSYFEALGTNPKSREGKVLNFLVGNNW